MKFPVTGILAVLILSVAASLTASLSAEPPGRILRFHMKHPMKSVNGRCDEVAFSAPPAFKKEGDGLVLAAPVAVTCPISSLHTGDANRDSHAYEAMHYPKHQAIIISVSDGKCSAVDCTINGTLNVAGVTKPIQLKAKREDAASSTRIHGTQIVKMTDHNITPPSLLFMPMDDAVVVDFDFSFPK